MEDCSIGINKPKPLIYISNDLTKRERLVFNFLVKLVNTQIKIEKPSYVFTLGNIKNVYNIRNFEVIRGILFKLTETKIEIDLLKNKRYLKVIENVLIRKTEIEVLFTNDFIDLFIDKHYAQIDLKVMSKLNSKYSIIIYEMIKDYYRKNNYFVQIPHIELQIFKRLMGNEKLSNSDLKRFVLDKIIIDIEKHTDFNLKYSFLNKNGSKKYTHIEIKFSKEKLEEVKKKKLNQRGEEYFDLVKRQIKLEEATQKYKDAVKEFNKMVDDNNSY
mgnify:CR=1 FL=1